MRISIVFCALILTAAGCVPLNQGNLSVTPYLTPQPDARAVTGSFEGTILSGGLERHYRAYVPSTYTTDRMYALVVDFHGMQANSYDEELLTGFSRLAEEEGFIVLYPDGRDRHWEVGIDAASRVDLQYVVDLLDYLKTIYSIDPRRIYAAGMSNGGGMANRVGCDLAHIFAAIAPVAGAYAYWQDCNPARPVAVISFHGVEDTVIPFTGKGTVLPAIQDWAAQWAKRNDCDHVPVVTDYTDSVQRETWQHCEQDAEVTLYVVEQHAHGWPGSLIQAELTSQAVYATEMIWQFFMDHPMP